MSTLFEAPAQYDRDLRSARKDYKRFKDLSAKWSHGERHLAGVHVDVVSGMPVTGSPSQQAGSRPYLKPINHNSNYPKKHGQNIVKTSRGHNQDVPSARFRAHISANEELKDNPGSIFDLLPSPGKMTVSDGFLYSFDRVDSPPTGVSLGVFIDNPKETDKYVAQEYQIVDDNGEALKGKKARRNLRKAANSPPKEVTVPAQSVDDDGFELV